MTDTVVAEGQVKFRDGKKWKTRWVVLRKPSPVADCLFLVAYKKDKKKSKKGIGQKDSLTLEGVCGVEPAPGFDGVSYSLSILCLSHTLVLGFSSREALQAWDARIRFHLREVHRFSVNVEPGSKLEAGPASLHLCNSVLVLSRGLPPLVTGHWKLSSLRRYGAVPNGFVFEGGSRCGYWSGVFYLSSSDGEQISFLVDCIVRGVSLNRSSQRLHPANPADANPVSEERVLQETSDLEKRLSRLSSCSLASSTASTFSCSTSIAGDDHSSISSSSSTQSDTSYGPRLPFWPESSSRLRSSTDTASSCSTLKPLTVSDDRLYAAATGNPRRLHDSGRQSSLDSGIGIAASSQSSGSYTESLDATIAQGQGFGSAPSLASPQTLAEPPLSPPPPPPIEAAHTPNASSFICISPVQIPEHRAPSVFRLRYDTPRSLLQSASLWDTPTPNPSEDSPNAEGYWWSGGPPKVIVQNSATWGSNGHETPRARSVPASLFNGRKQQCGHAADNYITSEQWQTVGSTTTKKVEKWASARTTATSKPDEQNYGALGSMLARLKMSLPSSPPPAPSALPARPATTCGVFGPERVTASCGLDPSLYLHNSVHYVNLPFSSMLLHKDRAATGSTHTVPPPAEGSTGAAATRGGRPWGRHGTPH